jgi:sulfopyruvate decarboxylase subunit beta
MDTDAAIRVVVESGADAAIIFTTGYTCRQALAVRDSPNHFYMTGSMGLAAVIGIGLAHARGDLPVIVVDGDGSFLMNPSNIVMIRACQVRNVHHLVLDNGEYASTGRQPTASRHVDLAGAARALGYDDVRSIGDRAQLAERLREVITRGSGSAFSHCRVSSAESSPGARLQLPLQELRDRFGSWVAQVARPSPAGGAT